MHRNGGSVRPGWMSRRAVVVAVLGLFVSALTVVTSSSPPVSDAAEPECTISAKLVNSCRPWLGAESGDYGVGTGSGRGCSSTRRGSVARSTSCTPTSAPAVGADQRHGDPGQAAGDHRDDQLEAVAQRGPTATAGTRRSTPRSTRWPTASRRWARPRSCSRSTTSPRATSRAGGSPSCPTPVLQRQRRVDADYVDMWHNVRDRFDALGVDNVVWVMNYMGYVDLALRRRRTSGRATTTSTG